MRGTRTRRAIPAATLLAIGLAACGSSSTTHTSTAARTVNAGTTAAASTPATASTPTSTAAATQTATSTTSSTSSTAVVPASFRAALNRIQGPYKAMARDVATEMQSASSQSDATFEVHLVALAKRAGHLEEQLAAVVTPAAFTDGMSKLRGGTAAIVADLTRLATAAASHNVKLAREATTALRYQAFPEVAAGIAELKRQGVK